MEYDENNLSERAMGELEYDISFKCSRFHIPGYERDDLEQECRLRLWEQLCKNKFDVYRGPSFRTWAQNVINNHLKNLFYASETQKRKANKKILYITYRSNLIFEDIQDGQEENTSGDIQG